MSYLDRLMAKIAETQDQDEPTKPLEPGLEGFVGKSVGHISEIMNGARSALPAAAASLEQGGGSLAVATWRDGLASLYPDKPRNGISLDRWRRMLLDGDAFLTDWGEQAAALGWTADNLFACPPRGGRRLDLDGLVTGLEGRLVVLMTDSHAMIDAGDGKLWRHQRRPRPGAVLWWLV